MAELKDLLREAVPASAPTFDADDIRAGVRRAQHRRQAVFGVVALALLGLIGTTAFLASRSSDPTNIAAAEGDAPSLAGVRLQVRTDAELPPGIPTVGEGPDGGERGPMPLPGQLADNVIAVGDGLGLLDPAARSITIWCRPDAVALTSAVIMRDTQRALPDPALRLLAARTMAELFPGCDYDTSAGELFSEAAGAAMVDPLATRIESAGLTACCGGPSTLSSTRDAFVWGIRLDGADVPFTAVLSSDLALAGGTVIECGDIVLLFDPTTSEETERRAVGGALRCADEPLVVTPPRPEPSPAVIDPTQVPSPAPSPTDAEPSQETEDPGRPLIAAMEREGYGPFDVTELEDGMFTFTFQPRESGTVGLEPIPVWVLVDPRGADSPAVSADTALVRLLDGEAAVLDGGELHFTCEGVAITTTGPGAGGSSLTGVGELPATIGCTPRPPGIPNELDRFQSIREVRLQQVFAEMGIPPGELSGEPSHGGSDASYIVPFGGQEHILYAGRPRLDDPEFQVGPEMPFAGGVAHVAGVDDGLPGFAFECGDTYFELSRDHDGADALLDFGEALVDQLGCVPGDPGRAAD